MYTIGQAVMVSESPAHEWGGYRGVVSGINYDGHYPYLVTLDDPNPWPGKGAIWCCFGAEELQPVAVEQAA